MNEKANMPSDETTLQSVRNEMQMKMWRNTIIFPFLLSHLASSGNRNRTYDVKNIK